MGGRREREETGGWLREKRERRDWGWLREKRGNGGRREREEIGGG